MRLPRLPAAQLLPDLPWRPRQQPCWPCLHGWPVMGILRRQRGLLGLRELQSRFVDSLLGPHLVYQVVYVQGNPRVGAWRHLGQAAVLLVPVPSDPLPYRGSDQPPDAGFARACGVDERRECQRGHAWVPPEDRRGRCSRRRRHFDPRP